MNPEESVNDEIFKIMDINNDDNCSRSESFDSNQLSTCNFSTRVYDSGNFSSSNISEISSLIDFQLCSMGMTSVEDGLYTKSIKANITETDDGNSGNKFHDIIRGKDQSLMLAFQDIRKLKSELERLSKSENWYKAELKTQKSARRELVEKLYLNEREHVQQTQRLHSECAKQQNICNDLKRQLQKEKDSHLKELNEFKSQEEKVPTNSISIDFQNKRNANIIEDQKIIIDVLRNQKQTLLNDLNVLENEKNSNIIELQKDNAELVTENRQLTKQCLQLMETRTFLEEQLLIQEKSNKKLNDLLDSQQQQSILSIANDLNSNNCLQEKIDSLQRQNEIMQLEIKKLEESTQMELQEKILEIENLKVFEQHKINQIEELEKQIISLHESQQDLENIIELKDVQLIEKLSEESVNYTQLEVSVANLNKQNSSQSSELSRLQNIEREFLILNEKYKEIYKLCEKTNFDVDVNNIEVKKLKFERDNSYKEVKNLREKIKEITIQEDVFKRNKIELNKLKLQLDQLQLENIDFITKMAELNDKLRICNQNKEIITNKNVKLNETITRLTKQLQLNQNELKELTTDSEVHAKCKNVLQSNKERIEKLENKLKQVQLEKEACESNLISIKEENTIFKNQMQLLREKFNNLRHYIINESHNENEKNHEVGKKRIEVLQLLLNQQSSKVIHLNQETNEWTNFLEHLFTAQFFDDDTSTLKIDHLDHGSVDSSSKSDSKNTMNLQNDIDFLNSQISCLKKFNEIFLRELNAAMKREREHVVQTENLHFSQIEFLKNNKERLEQEFSEIHRKTNNINSEKFEIIKMEHRNKIDRYESHILSLMNNIQSNKNNLKITEETYEVFLNNYKKSDEAQMQVETTCEQCKSIEIKYQNCLQTINMLQRQLETACYQFVEIEMYKKSNAEMCDENKLIQLIPTSKKYSINKIDDLINRSKNSVPNLIKLTNCVDGLKDDIQKLLQTTTSAGRCSPLIIRKKSLMYELKQAEADFISCT